MTETIRQQLFALQDPAYRAFQAKLMPTVDTDRIIGVRTPALRALAKELKSAPGIETFLADLPHGYYEEDNLHAFLLEQIKDYDICVAALCDFLPYVDNWATCDCMRPKCLKKQPDKLLEQIVIWLSAKNVYTVRYAIGLLLSFYLDEHFAVQHLETVAAIRSKEYYINMMVAWYFATALAKQWDSTIPYIEQCHLPPWVHNKTIRKAIESYRITPEQKAYLRTLKVH